MILRYESYRHHLETLFAALAGIVIFISLGLPTPTLSGAMVGVAVYIALGRKAVVSSYLRDFGMLISGVAMGTSVTPEMLQGFYRFPLSLLMLFATLSVGMFLSYLFLRLVGRWDRDSAFFACVPGALTVVLSMASDSKADIAKVSIAQSCRLFLLFAVLPTLVTMQGTGASLPSSAAMSVGAFVITFSGAVLLSLLLKSLHFAAPWVFGGMIASALLHGTGTIVGDAHPWLKQIGFSLVGAFIGTRFAGIDRETFFKLLLVSVGSILIGIVVTVASAMIAERILFGVTFGQALVAFAPGAIEGMVILGAALTLDPIYVGLHHLVRFIGIGFILPFGYALFKTADRSR